MLIPPVMEPLTLDTRMALLRQHGSFTQAYSATVQPDLLHFGDETGFIAYKNVWGTAMALADPVAAPQSVDRLLDRFLQAHADAAFWQISRPLAGKLAARGFLVNEFGFETRLELEGYTFEGQRKRNLRKATRRAAELGYLVRECRPSELDNKAIEAVTAMWWKERPSGRRDVSFLNRPIAFVDEPDVRWFVAFDPAGSIVGYCVCDPIFSDGAVVGYSTSASRQLHDTVMVGHAVKHHAVLAFQREGRRQLNLGLSPVDGIEDQDFEYDWAIRRGLAYCFRSALFNRFVYSLQGHAQHKRQFGGTTEQTYIAFNKRPGVLRMVKLLKACNII
jgi:lysylphosphatidylglycerol synthetase-like protein (DUF2156 family)